jgi:hypothetical protein
MTDWDLSMTFVHPSKTVQSIDIKAKSERKRALARVRKQEFRKRLKANPEKHEEELKVTNDRSEKWYYNQKHKKKT